MFLTKGGNTGTNALLFASPEQCSVKVNRSNTEAALLALEPERFVKGCPWCFLFIVFVLAPLHQAVIHGQPHMATSQLHI